MSKGGFDMKMFSRFFALCALPVLLALSTAVFADGTGTDLIKNNDTDGGGCENQEGSGSDCPCNDTSNPDPDSGCVQLSVNMGQSRYSALTKGVFLQMKELQATSQLYSPDSFKVLAGYTVKRASWEKTAAGLPKWVLVASDGGLLTDFYFADGESVGVVPAGPESRTKQRLAMVDAQGWATATDPMYYDFYPGDGSRWRFGAAKTAPDYLSFIEHQTPAGRVETKQDLGLEIIRDANGVLRQVATPARLADFVVTGQDAYDLSVYPNDASCVTGDRAVEGYYVIAAGAVPEVVWKFRNPTPGTYGVLNVTRQAAGTESKTWTYTFVEAVNDFVLTYPNGVREDRSERLKSDDGATMTIKKEAHDASGAVFGKKESHYVKNNYKYLRKSETRDPGGLNLTTTYSYYSGGATDGLEKQRIAEDGSWTLREYDDSRRLTAAIRPWLDAPTNAPVTQCSVTRTSYGLFEPGDFLVYNDQRPRTEIKEICGVEVSRTYHAYPTNALGQAQEIEERAAFRGAPYGHVSNPRTVKTYYAASAALPLPGRLATITYPGGKVEEYGYEYGSFNASTFAFTPDPDGGAWRETVTTTYASTPNSSLLTPKSTRSVRVWDERGREVLNESNVEDGASFALIGWTHLSYDRNGKLIETAYSDGRVVSATWGANCCGKESETSAEGLITVYGYNELKQKVSETKKGMAADGSGDIATLYTYDLENRVLSIAVTNVASGLGYVASRSAYDAVGRLTNAVDRLGNATVYSYPATDNRQVAPNGVTNLTERYLDGSTKRVLENGVVKQSYAYGVNPDGARWTLSADGPLPATIQSTLELPNFSTLELLNFPWQLQATDPLGRSVATYKPGFGRSVLVTSNTFDIANNRLSSTQYAISLNSDGSVILSRNLYSYAADGSLNVTALDFNTNGVIDLEGPDRITGSSAAYEKDAANAWWQVSRSWVYPEFNSSTAVTTSVQRVRLTGLGNPFAVASSGVSLASLRTSLTESIDVHGNITSSSTLIDHSARTVMQIAVAPISTRPAIQIIVNGLMITNLSASAVTTSYGYDSLDRQISVVQGGPCSSCLAGVDTHYNAFGQVDYIEDGSSNRTYYSYDTLGRRIAVTDALGNVINTAYNSENQVIAIWGATQPVAYEYDEQRGVFAMASYRGTNEFSSYASFQSIISNFDKTRWLYDKPTGLITNKLYSDGKGPSYTYTSDGNLARRTWVRITSDFRPLTADYSYDLSGNLTDIVYSDGSTPNVSVVFDRLGRQKTIVDGTGLRTFTYDNLLQQTAETNAYGVFVRSYDMLGRSAGLTFGPNYTVVYDYDSIGHFASASSSVQTASLLSQYAYLPGADRVTGWSNSAGFSSIRTYEPKREQILAVTNMFNGVVESSFVYGNDALGRRVSRLDSIGATNCFGYNSRSELIDSSMGTNHYGYAYDPAGNRINVANNAVAFAYEANTLNQYTNISDGGVVTPLYDSDGNLISYGICTFTWDAENRLIMASNGATVVSYAYDYMSRRVAKSVNGSAHQFIYDGWAMIREINGETTNSYVYGLDMGGSIQGAGTIGGLLTASLDGTAVSYAYDANGNVTDLVDLNGISVAHYEYDPYGNITVQTGALANANPFRFSTKYQDLETGLCYYGFRHYSPQLGRWISRDPIHELAFGLQNGRYAIPYSLAGLTSIISVPNETMFVQNMPTALVDFLGLCDTSCQDSNVSTVLNLNFSISNFTSFRLQYSHNEKKHVCGVSCGKCPERCGIAGKFSTDDSGSFSGSNKIPVPYVKDIDIRYGFGLGNREVRTLNTCNNQDETEKCKTFKLSGGAGKCLDLGAIKFCLTINFAYSETECDGVVNHKSEFVATYQHCMPGDWNKRAQVCREFPFFNH
jgi:RHS repeat-associated protein